MADELRQSLLISEASDCLLNLPVQSKGALHIPFNPKTRRYALTENLETAFFLFRDYVDVLEIDAVFRELESPKYYGGAPICFNLGVSLACLAVFVCVKACVIFAWFFVLLDPLVLFGGLWLIKKVVILLCVFRLDLLNKKRNSPLRSHLKVLNSTWTQRGVSWSLDSQNNFLTLTPVTSTTS